MGAVRWRGREPIMRISASSLRRSVAPSLRRFSQLADLTMMAPSEQRGGSASGGGASPQDILRLSARQTAAILDWMDGRTRPWTGPERRKSPRAPYRLISRVGVLLENEPKGQRTFALAPRNLGRMGVSLLHGKFVYGGTNCIIVLHGRNGQVMPARGKVVWCRLVTGRIHELGVELEEPIELKSYVESKAAA